MRVSRAWQDLRILNLAVTTLGAIVLLSASLQNNAAASQTQTSASTETNLAAAEGDFAGLVDIGAGRKLYLECRGAGRPTVLLESGLRTRGDNWNRADLLTSPGKPVMDQVALLTRVCTYDRPGTTLHPGETSRSDAAQMPRTARDVVFDLHRLLHATGVPGPVVMVGHSFGGLFVRLYAALYREEVCGLVLDDALAEQIRPLMKASDWTTFLALNNGPLPGFEKYAELETIEFDKSMAQMLQASKDKPLQQLPVVVLVRGRPVDLPASAPGKFGEMLEAAWRKSEDELAASFPRAPYRVAKKSGHYIQFDQPDVVVDSIRDVVEAARHGQKVGAGKATR